MLAYLNKIWEEEEKKNREEKFGEKFVGNLSTFSQCKFQ